MFILHLTMIDKSYRKILTPRVTVFEKNTGVWRDKGDRIIVIGTLPKVEWVELKDVEYFWVETE